MIPEFDSRKEDTMTPAIPDPAVQTDIGQQILTDLEKVGLGLLAAAPSATQIFVHSKQGLLWLNASELVLGSILSALTKR